MQNTSKELKKAILLIGGILLAFILVIGFVFYTKNSREARRAEIERPQIAALQAELRKVNQELKDAKERLAYYTDIKEILDPVVGTPSVSQGSPLVILSPAAGQSYCNNNLMTFRWQTPTGLGPINIYAVKDSGSTLVARNLPLVTKNPFNFAIGTGEYLWDMRLPTPPYNRIEPGQNYKFQVATTLEGEIVITETNGFVAIKDCSR
jgi:hypothetical protein